jgi:hypothetical protein
MTYVFNPKKYPHLLQEKTQNVPRGNRGVDNRPGKFRSKNVSKPVTSSTTTTTMDDFTKVHHPPRFNIHEIPKLIRVLRHTKNFYDEANAWEQYLVYYRQYEKDYEVYRKDCKLYEQGLLEKKPEPPCMCAEPNVDAYAERRGPPGEYKRPLRYQGTAISAQPFKMTYDMGLKNNRTWGKKGKPRGGVDVRRLNEGTIFTKGSKIMNGEDAFQSDYFPSFYFAEEYYAEPLSP